MAFIGRNMRGADGVSCALCSEPMPPYTALCPNCIVAKNPLDILEDMKRLIVEVEQNSAISDDSFREIEATFWTLHGAAAASFGREESVVEALIALENIIYDIIDARAQKRLAKMRKRLLIAMAVVSVMILVAVVATIL